MRQIPRGDVVEGSLGKDTELSCLQLAPSPHNYDTIKRLGYPISHSRSAPPPPSSLLQLQREKRGGGVALLHETLPSLSLALFHCLSLSLSLYL